MRRVFGVVGVAIGLLFFGPASADESQAAAKFHEGEAAYAKRDFKAAGEAFEAAFREAPSGAALYAAGIAWEAAGEPAHAADDYERAAKLGGLQTTQGKDLDSRLANLKKKLGRIEVRAPSAKVTIDDGPASDAPVSAYAAPGPHVVVIVFPGAEKRARAVQVEAGGSLAIDLDAPPPVPTVSASPAGTPSSAASALSPPPDKVESSPLRTVGFITMGVGAASLLASIPLGVGALGARNTFNSSGYHDRSAHDQAATLRAATNVALIVGGLAVAGGFTLVLLAPKRPAEASSKVALKLGVGSLSAAGEF